MTSHQCLNSVPSNASEPIYCNLIDYDDFGLDSRLERLRVSAINANNNNDAINPPPPPSSSSSSSHQHQVSLPNRQQATNIICVQTPQTTQKQHHQQQQHQIQPQLQNNQPKHQQNLQQTNQQSQPQPQSQPQLQQPQQLLQPQLEQQTHQKNSAIQYIQELISASSTLSHHHNHISYHPIEYSDCYLNSPTKDSVLGDASFNSRQLDSTLSSNNQRFQSYKYLTQVWPESSASTMLDSPLGRKVYQVAAEQTKTLSPPKEKCVKNYGRVKSWGNSFDNLLNDAIGVKIYSRFLSREFSDENILFWLACEKYKKMIKKTEARKEAKAIYDQFLTINGSHTVNVDADARNSVAKNLKKPTKELFDIPQTQVYNLMKNDSYKRFLTSELYEMCLESEKTGKPLPVCSKDDCDKKKVPSSSKRRLSLGSWVLKKAFRK